MEVNLKPGNFIGRSLPNRDGIAKSKGQAQYIEDLRLPGMLYGAVIRSPHHHGKVISINKDEVLAMPGVKALATYENLEEGTTGELYNSAGSPPSPFVLPDEQILTAKPRFCGDRVAAIAAANPQYLEDAVAALRVEYAVLPYVQGLREAMADDAPRLHGNKPGNITKTIDSQAGDCEKAFAAAQYIHISRYHTHLQQGAPLETSGCICHYSEAEMLTVWSNTQTPHQDKRILARLFGLPISNVRCIEPAIGGGFGSRQQIHEQSVAALLSKLTRCPVRIIHSRQEEFISALRHPAEIELKSGYGDSGKIQAMEIKVWLNTGAYAGHGPVVMAAMKGRMPYNIPNYHYQGYCVYSNLPSAGALRGYGNPQLTFARESHLNEIAEKLHMDPVELRLKNHLQKGQHIPGLPWAVESCGISECASRGAQLKKEFQSKLDREENQENEKQGWGVAFCMHGSGISDRDMSSAIVMMNDDGSFQLINAAVEMGQGSRQTIVQIAAEELGLAELSQLNFLNGDTAATPYDVGAFGSRQLYMCGRAVQDAARKAREKLLALAAGCQDIFPERADVANLRIEKGYLYQGQKQVCDLAYLGKKLSFGEESRWVIGSATFKPYSSPPPFALCWADVRVNLQTGRVRVPRIILCADVGRAINPGIVKGQIQGGVMMGLGYAIDEQVYLDRASGELKNTGFMSYGMPTMKESVTVAVEIIESQEPTGPFGAKSVGELPLIPVAAAVANGFYEATGIRIRELPLTPERVLTYLRAR